MTAREAIAAADAEKPNAFDEKTKFEWLRRLEGRLMANVFLMAPPRSGSWTWTTRRTWTGSCCRPRLTMTSTPST